MDELVAARPIPTSNLILPHLDYICPCMFSRHSEVSVWMGTMRKDVLAAAGKKRFLGPKSFTPLLLHGLAIFQHFATPPGIRHSISATSAIPVQVQ
jgi:hypothetical protein